MSHTMTKRERLLAFILLGGVILGGAGFLYFQVYQVALSERRETAERLRTEIEKNQAHIDDVQRQKATLDLARQLSLPQDVDLDRREYEKYLGELLRDSGFAAGSVSVKSESPDVNRAPKLGAKKEPIYTVLPFAITGRGTLASLVEAMERFYETGLLHRIKSFSIQRPLTATAQQRRDELDFTMTVEAVIVNGAANRPYLLPNIPRWMLVSDVVTSMRHGPTGLALALWAAGPAGPLGPANRPNPPRQYASIGGKNIFFGSVPSEVKDNTDVTRFVKLTDITQTQFRAEAWLYDQYNNRSTRLRASAGFDAFRVLDNHGEPLVRGKVIHLGQRDVVFRVDENYYALHVGQSLEEAMKKPLTADQLRSYGLEKKASAQ